MTYIVESERRTPVVEEADVLVVGGGTAGMTAAVAAARTGVRTLLVERWGYVGGAAVGGLVVTVPENAGIWGIEREFYDALEAMGGLAIEPATDAMGRPFILSAPLAKILGDRFVLDAGVVPIYHTWFCDVVMEGDRIDAVIVESKSGRQALRAKVVVDSTGDADVAHRAGAPCRKGHDGGSMLPVTTMYNCVNVDVEAYRRRSNVKTERRLSARWITHVNPGELNCWGGRVEGDGTDNRDLTRMEIELRRQILEEFQNMRELIPGMAESFISIIAEQIGVRETRLIDADYVLTKADCDAGRQFEDSIGVCWSFTVPYRSLIPRKVSNLLVAGRCIGSESADKIRIVPNCRTTGQAAGLAAAMAARDSGAVRAVDVERLQKALDAQNVRLRV